MISKYYLNYLLCILILFVSVFFAPTLLAAENIDLNTSTTYNLKINGGFGSPGGYLTAPMRSLNADLDNDGLNDLIFGAINSDMGSVVYLGATLNNYYRGTVYIIPGTVLRDHLGKGQTIDLSDSSNYWIRYVTDVFGQYGAPVVGDIDGDSKLDLVLADSRAAPWGSPTGHVYVIPNNLMTQYTGTGNIVDLMSTSTAYKVYYQPDTNFESWGEAVKLGDIDNNGKDDLIIADSFYDVPASHDGTFYIIKDSLINALPGTGNTKSLATTSNFSIQYQLTGNSPNLTRGDMVITDLNNDNLNDIAVAALNDDPSGRDDAGSVFVLYNSLINANSGTGNIVDLAQSANYNIRFMGATINEWFGGSMVDAGDIDGDGKKDLAMGAFHGSNNGIASSGSLYIVNNTSFSGITGTGNSIDMSDTSKWWLRIDGPVAGSGNSGFATTGFLVDYDGNGKADVLVASRDSDNNSRNNSGSIYGFLDTIVNSFISTGNIINLASSTNYTFRYDGPTVDKALGGSGGLSNPRHSIGFSDINNDKKPDLILGGNYYVDPVSFYVVYNFPHTLSLTNFPQNNIGAGFGFTGHIQAPNSTTNVSGIQYQLNSNNPQGAWTDCVAEDGSFDSTDEKFKCAVSGLTQQAYTVYIRAKDTLTSYTAKINYLSQAFNPFGPYVSSPEVGGSVPNPYQCSKEKPSGNVELFQISVTDKTATLYFTPANNNVSGYAIEYGYKVGDSRFAVEFDHSASSGVVSYTVNELTPNTQYAFRVVPRNGCNAGEWTAWLAAKTVSKGQRTKQFYLYNKIK